MPWNLVEALLDPEGRRPFCLPLARKAVNFSGITQAQYEPNDDRTTDPNAPRLHITIKPPQGGQFVAGQDSLPDPAIRLYAMGAAWVRFKPADATRKDSLELRLAAFAAFPLRKTLGGPDFPLWWGRWLEAGCIPDRVVYENADAALVRAALEGVQAPIDNQFENRVMPVLGLQFPYSVTEATRSDFIDHFMAGDEDCFMVAEAGAYLGAAAPASPSANGPTADRLLTLHAQYHDHTQTSPHPLNPLELFNLLFGDGSDEAKNHPLLLAIDAKGKLQSGHESKSMRRRPPLRTHARLMWEADIETVDENLVGATPKAQQNAPMWESMNSVQSRLFNDFSGTDEEGTARHFNKGAYNTCKDENGNLTGCWKCNLFTFDVALRAGFRVMIHTIKQTSVWHYREPNDTVRKVGAAQPDPGQQQLTRVPVRIKFDNGLRTETLAWNIEGLLRQLVSNQIGEEMTRLREEITRQISEEGRCFVAAGSHASGSSGHMVLVESLLADDFIYQLQLTPSGGRGFKTLPVLTRGVTSYGAQKRELTFQAGPSDYSFVYLFELHPGKDPDTPLGLRDCNGAVYSPAN